MKKLAIALLLTACAVSALADALPQYGAIATGIGIDRTGTPISMQGSAGGDDREEVRRRAVDNCKIQESNSTRSVRSREDRAARLRCCGA
jgi:hypothetical protein